jgi:hypothetical protein
VGWNSRKVTGDPCNFSSKGPCSRRHPSVTEYASGSSRRASSTAWVSVPPTWSESRKKKTFRRFGPSNPALFSSGSEIWPTPWIAVIILLIWFCLEFYCSIRVGSKRSQPKEQNHASQQHHANDCSTVEVEFIDPPGLPCPEKNDSTVNISS